MSLTRPPMTDDTGTKTDGTIVNKALFDAIIDEIDAALDSPTNPGETVVGIIDEVVEARGSEASLDDRLDVALNEDGTLKTGAIPEADLSGAQRAPDLVVNGDFRTWTVPVPGAGPLPASWSSNPGSGALATDRTGPAESDTTHVGVGFRSVKISGSAGGGIFQRSIPLGRFTAEFSGLVGRTVVAVAHVIANSPNSARLTLFDEVGFTASSYHSGNGTVEVLAVKHVVNAGATRLGINLLNDNASAVYFGGISLYVADYLPKGWDYARPVRNRGHLHALATDAATSGTSATVVGSHTLLANQLPLEEPERLPQVNVEAWGIADSNANVKTFSLEVGGTAVTCPTTTGTGTVWRFQARIVRTGPATQRVWVSVDFGASGALQAASDLTKDFTADILLELKATMATAGTITLRSFRVWIS